MSFPIDRTPTSILLPTPSVQKAMKKQQSKKKSSPKKMNNTDSHAPSRPYTEYNIFFQIEREFILQNLGVVPKLEPSEVFNAATDKNYEGPKNLPAKYDGLVLPSDWYIPGKGRRKKRQHVASHGKISFTDLSKSVAAAWRKRCEETKKFTKALSDAGMKKFKRELKEYQDLISSGVLPVPVAPIVKERKNAKKKSAKSTKSKKGSSSTAEAAQGSSSITLTVTAPSSPVFSQSTANPGHVTPTLPLDAWNTIQQPTLPFNAWDTIQHPTSTSNSNTSAFELRRQVSNDCLTSYAAEFDISVANNISQFDSMPPLDPSPEDTLSDCSLVDMGDDDIISMYMSFVNSP